MKSVRRHITLIEMMIVMFLIALIMGVIAFNYRGTLEEGKVFKTKAGIERLETILNLAVSERPELLDRMTTQWQEVVRISPLVKDPEALIHDGWGNLYEVTVEHGEVRVSSPRYEEVVRQKGGQTVRSRVS